MVTKIVGWFATLAGLLLCVHMGHKAYIRLSQGQLAAQDYAHVAMAAVFALAGLVLVVFGLRRLRARPPSSQRRSEPPENGLQG